ncbi:zinc finger bed domain-containing protein daysleeper [Quercus suber]|uniref:Zinc finger bed domain-containing protein daysleeper n=1 Tax=Quercus suber TaxID=58331 RepID=A0AAW0LS34_QUESU
MEADNENHQTNVVESGNDACGHECVHGNSHGSSSDGENSVNDDDYDFEQRNASRFLGLLTCTNDVLPLDGMFMHTLRIRDPVFERVSFDSIKDDCLIHYEKMRETAEQVLRNFDGQISLSVDILRCRKAYEYMCLKAHFITEDWNLGNWVLNFRRINATWEDDCLDGAILKVLRGWDIGNKIASITFLTDWVYDEGIDNVKEYVQEMKKLQFNGQIFRLYCSADIFKSMVQDAFKVISGTICKIDELMYFGKPSYLWDLAYDRLKMALECEAKEEFGKEGYDSCDKPSADEWKKVEGIFSTVVLAIRSLYDIYNIQFPETENRVSNPTSADSGDMEADHENYQTNDVESDGDACGDECDHGSDHGDSHGCSSDGESSVNDDDFDFEQRNASQFLGLLTCTRNVLPLEGLFMNMLQISDPVFKRVSFDSVEDDCLKLYKEMKEHIEQAAFEAIAGTISTIDDLMYFGKPLYLWDATYDRLKTAFEEKEEFSKEEYNDWDKPSADEWKKVEGIFSTVVMAIRSLYDDYCIQFPETENPVSNPTSDSGVGITVLLVFLPVAYMFSQQILTAC